MSFFKDFKDDLTQAVNELLPDNKVSEEETVDQMVNTLDSFDDTEKDKMKELLEEFANDEYQSEMETTEEFGNDLEEIEDNIDDLKRIDNLENYEIDENKILEDETMEENIDLDLLDALDMDHENVEMEEKKEKLTNRLKDSIVNDDDVTIITKGTTINGSISSDGSLNIMGTIMGDVECLGKLSIMGKIVGNSTASEVYVNTERLEGSICSEGSIKVGLGSVILGDITATSGVIAGAVKGEIDVNGPIVIDSTAIIKGNIKAKSVQINNGAVIEGFCSLSYSSVDVDNIFE